MIPTTTNQNRDTHHLASPRQNRDTHDLDTPRKDWDTHHFRQNRDWDTQRFPSPRRDWDTHRLASPPRDWDTHGLSSARWDWDTHGFSFSRIGDTQRLANFATKLRVTGKHGAAQAGMPKLLGTPTFQPDRDWDPHGLSQNRDRDTHRLANFATKLRITDKHGAAQAGMPKLLGTPTFQPDRDWDTHGLSQNRDRDTHRLANFATKLRITDKHGAAQAGMPKLLGTPTFQPDRDWDTHDLISARWDWRWDWDTHGLTSPRRDWDTQRLASAPQDWDTHGLAGCTTLLRITDKHGAAQAGMPKLLGIPTFQPDRDWDTHDLTSPRRDWDTQRLASAPSRLGHPSFQPLPRSGHPWFLSSKK